MMDTTWAQLLLHANHVAHVFLLGGVSPEAFENASNQAL